MKKVPLVVLKGNKREVVGEALVEVTPEGNVDVIAAEVDPDSPLSKLLNAQFINSTMGLGW